MSLAYEKNVDLAFNSTILKESGRRYSEIADELRVMASNLDGYLKDLINDGWTTPAGKAFEKMTNTEWSENVEKYASLLDTLNNILCKAADDYEDLVLNNIELIALSDQQNSKGGCGF